jgi:hypothetical protein
MASSINVPLQQNLTQPKVLIRHHSIQNSRNKTSKETIFPVLMMQKEIVTQLFLGKQNPNASTNPIEIQGRVEIT